MHPSIICRITFGAALLVSAALASSQTRPATRSAAHDFARWEAAVAAYEKSDAEQPPARGGVLFIGSSTIRGWRSLAADYPEHNVINRGFGGSQIVDATHFADRLIFPHEPKMVLLRAGGNDIHGGKSAEQVFGEFQAFVKKVHEKLPATDIVFIGLAPAPARWDERETNKALNALVKQFATHTPRVKYVETYDTTITSDGQPRHDLFLKDKLHFNSEGYEVMAERVRSVLPAKQ